MCIDGQGKSFLKIKGTLVPFLVKLQTVDFQLCLRNNLCFHKNLEQPLAEAYLGHRQISMLKLFAKIVYLLTTNVPII